MKTKILGINCLGSYDVSAALIIDGEIIAAAQEERFTRKKHDPSYPVKAINYCLSEAGLSLAQVDHIAFYDKPFLKFERLLETYVAFAPKGLQSFRMAMPVWLREKLFLKQMLIKEIKKVDKNFDTTKLMFGEHHFSHAASAFYPSPFEEAIILTLDGVGEWATTTVSIGKKNEIKIEVSEINKFAKKCPKNIEKALIFAAARIKKFHKYQLPKNYKYYETVGCFNLDFTIIKPKNNRRKPIDCYDWVYLNNQVKKKLEYKERVIMLDHDDLYSNLLKSKLPPSKFTFFINKLTEFCNSNNIILLRTIGVIFSDEEKRISEYIK